MTTQSHKSLKYDTDMCVYIDTFVYTHTQSFCDFQRLFGGRSPPTVCFQVLTPDPNRGRENPKYCVPGDTGLFCHSSSGKPRSKYCPRSALLK